MMSDLSTEVCSPLCVYFYEGRFFPFPRVCLLSPTTFPSLVQARTCACFLSIVSLPLSVASSLVRTRTCARVRCLWLSFSLSFSVKISRFLTEVCLPAFHTCCIASIPDATNLAHNFPMCLHWVIEDSHVGLYPVWSLRVTLSFALSVSLSRSTLSQTKSVALL